MEKVRAPTSTSSDDATVREGSYIWAMAQAHRVSNDFMAAQWRYHASIAGIINYHVFQFMVPLSAHTLLKEKIFSLRKLDKDRQMELSKLMTRLLKMENRK